MDFSSGMIDEIKSSYCSIPAAFWGRSSKTFCAAAVRFLGESVFGKGTPEVTSMICPCFLLSVK